MKMVLPVDGYRSATEFMEALQGSEGDTHWLMKKAEHWHGGIHIYDSFAANAVFKPDSHGLKCMADGQVVAWRLNDDYQTAPFKKKMLKFSTTFVLIKSTCTPDKDKPDNSLDFYTLWMQIAPLSEYGVTDTPTATVTASALKIRQDNTFSGWMRNGMSQGINVPRDALRHYEAPQDTHTTLPRGSVVEIEQEATFILNGKPAPFIFITVVSVPEGAKTGLSVGESGWISGLDKFVKRQDITLPAWMQEARKHGVFNEVVTVSVEDALPIKAGDVIGHLSLNEQPYGNSQYFCHLEVFSQDARMKDFLTNKAGVTKGVAELHTLADKMRWQHRDRDNSFVVAGVGGDPSPTTAERYTPETQCRRLEADGKTWYYIPGELAWMAAEDVERANQFDLEKRGFIPLEEEDAPQSIFQTPRESWLRQTFGRLEELARGETRDMYSSSYTEKYQKLLKQMDSNQDGVIDGGELWRFLHNRQPHIQYQVQRLVVKHHSEWLKDGTSALWQAALDEQAKKYPDLALFNRDFINKLVWMKDVPEIHSDEALWHMHPIVFLDAVSVSSLSLEEARARAFMRMLRVGEGTVGETGYETLFGGQSFIKDYHKDFSNHPQISITRGNLTSSAAGAYQVMGYTWNDPKMISHRAVAGIADFTPKSQDEFCVLIFKYKRKHSLDKIMSGDIDGALDILSYEWASLPPGRYGQPAKTKSEALSLYNYYLDEEVKGQTDLHLDIGYITKTAESE
ncbi:glycoside hydrolase family 104 protein [Enterobacter bugandensis]|uniref:glycoside hydrolase family 24 protein n=5 Tax=Enterobacter TaxID=547 RepID=UPI002003DB69|nr:glycoside hydrolase family 104 protein [Enterobacter bugandensis]MCK7434717.1 glycoside hydrolase family 104 protein [Enterobacter bugandensis]